MKEYLVHDIYSLLFHEHECQDDTNVTYRYAQFTLKYIIVRHRYIKLNHADIRLSHRKIQLLLDSVTSNIMGISSYIMAGMESLPYPGIQDTEKKSRFCEKLQIIPFNRLKTSFLTQN